MVTLIILTIFGYILLGSLIASFAIQKDLCYDKPLWSVDYKGKKVCGFTVSFIVLFWLPITAFYFIYTIRKIVFWPLKKILIDYPVWLAK